MSSPKAVKQRDRTGTDTPRSRPTEPRSGPNITNLTFAVPAPKVVQKVRPASRGVTPSPVGLPQQSPRGMRTDGSASRSSSRASSTSERPPSATPGLSVLSPAGTPHSPMSHADFHSAGSGASKQSLVSGRSRVSSPSYRRDPIRDTRGIASNPQALPPPSPPMPTSHRTGATAPASPVGHTPSTAHPAAMVRMLSPAHPVGHRRTNSGEAMKHASPGPVSRARMRANSNPDPGATLEGADLYAAYEQRVKQIDSSPLPAPAVVAVEQQQPAPPTVNETPQPVPSPTPSTRTAGSERAASEDEVEDDVDDCVLEASSDEDDKVGVVFNVDQWAKIGDAVVQNLNMSLKAVDPQQWSMLSEDSEQTLNKQLGDAMGAGATLSGTDQASLEALGVAHEEKHAEQEERLDAGLSMLRPTRPSRPKTSLAALARQYALEQQQQQPQQPHADHLNDRKSVGEEKLTDTLNDSSGLLDNHTNRRIEVVLWRTSCDHSRDDLSMSNSWAKHEHTAHNHTASLVKSVVRFGNRLARGAAGKVYQGSIEDTGEAVAIKQIRLQGTPVEYARTVQLEVSILQMLCHPNVVRYYGLHQTRDKMTAHIVLEFVDAGSLGHLLQARADSAFSEAETANILVQVLRGLSYLHSKKIIHRDLKPLNLLVTSKGVVKITDFGLSTQVLQTCSLRRTIVGTPWYVAPEVIMAEPYSFQADIWSIGCICSELVTGKRPYSGLVGVAAMFRMCEDASPPLPETGISDLCRSFIMQCWQKDWRKRPAADDLLQHDFLKLAKDAGPRWAAVDESS